MTRRLSTVYDYASLRLHRDGTRVQQSDENYNIPSRRRLAVKNANGNWIATDAGGLGTVRRTKYVRKGTDYLSLENEDQREVDKENEWLTVDVENERKRRRVTADHRPEKRRRFDENLDFLDAVHSTSYSAQTQLQKPCIPAPTSVRYLLFRTS